MNEVFDIIECPDPFRHELIFMSRNIYPVTYETAAFVGLRIWSYMSSELKEIKSLNEFRSRIKT